MLFSLTVQSIAVIMFIEGIRGPLIIISCYALKATFWKNIHFLAKGYLWAISNFSRPCRYTTNKKQQAVANGLVLLRLHL